MDTLRAPKSVPFPQWYTQHPPMALDRIPRDVYLTPRAVARTLEGKPDIPLGQRVIPKDNPFIHEGMSRTPMALHCIPRTVYRFPRGI